MKISIRTLTGEAAELDIPPTTTIAQLRLYVQDALNIPAPEQRFVYAGTQLQEEVTPAWRARRGSGEVASALGVASLPDGTPLTLEHYGLQKGSVINVVRRAISSSPQSTAESSAATAELQPEGPRINWSSTPNARPAAAAAGVPSQEKLPKVVESGGGGSGKLELLGAQLDGFSDLDLLTLLRPVLHRRPALRAALLAEDPGAAASAGSVQLSPAPSAADSQGPLQGAQQPARQVPFPANPAKPRFSPGDRVSVWSNSAQKWFPGEVVEVATVQDNMIPQGAVAVSFELGRKWIAPADVPRTLAPM